MFTRVCTEGVVGHHPSLTGITTTLNLIFTIHIESSQDGWRRLEYEEILAPAPPEESGAGLVGRKESCEYPLPSTAHLPTNPCPL